MNLYRKRLTSPIGELSLYATDKALIGLFFANADRSRLEKIFPGVQERENGILTRTSEELRAYFAGRLQRFTVPVAPSGTDFQKVVWRALQAIDFGELRSYGNIARAIGRPRPFEPWAGPSAATLWPSSSPATV
jgi:methylated-DNA-[protein]-cysteine S-methyltransferase